MRPPTPNPYPPTPIMRTYTASSIVLRRIDLGEKDRILTAYTRERGKLSARLWHPNGLSSDTIHLPENCRSQHSMLHPAASAPAHGPPTAPNDIIRAPHNSPAISAATNTLVTTQNRQAALRSGLTTVSLVCVGCSAFAFMGFKPNFFSAPRSPDNPPERSRR